MKESFRKDGTSMGDIFMVVLIFLMISYAFWDELFTN